MRNQIAVNFEFSYLKKQKLILMNTTCAWLWLYRVNLSIGLVQIERGLHTSFLDLSHILKWWCDAERLKDWPWNKSWESICCHPTNKGKANPDTRLIFFWTMKFGKFWVFSPKVVVMSMVSSEAYQHHQQYIRMSEQRYKMVDPSIHLDTPSLSHCVHRCAARNKGEIYKFK